jgi:hypothetical protein
MKANCYLGPTFILITQVNIKIKKMINQECSFYWLRWGLLVPISIGAGLLVSTVFGLVLPYVVDESSQEVYKHASAPLITSFLSVTLAYWIAPKYKLRTATIICSLWLLVVTLGLLITIVDIKLYGQEYEVKDGGMAIIMTACGLAFACCRIWRVQSSKIYMSDQTSVKSVEPGNKLTLKGLDHNLGEHGISSDSYYLHGLYGSNNDVDKIALSIKKGKYTLEYEVYYKEKGEKHSSRIFTDEHTACEWIFVKLINEQTFNKIQGIPGISGMTVNERLYVSGLMDEFESAITNNNKIRARQILTWLKVDEPSIDLIIKNEIG